VKQSDRAAATRHAILDAARDVFTTAGFSDANIADVVSRAGASVGSLYHHFGGKADLYLALFEDYEQRQEQRATAAVAQARAGGEASPMDLFVVGARAYLRGCWDERELARLFLAGGGPAGSELLGRKRFHEWARLNERLLGSYEEPGGPSSDALVLVLTTVVAEAGHEVAVCDHEAKATAFAEDVLTLIGRMARPRVSV
jgi:AcrR family transcriptional regulator